jgi:hypothetical protein
LSPSLRGRHGLAALVWIAGLCVTATACAHGGVSIEDDTCIMQIGPYRAHFTGYQPAARTQPVADDEDLPVREGQSR